MLITRAGVLWFFWFADFALWTLGSRQHVNTRAKGNPVKAVREGSTRQALASIHVTDRNETVIIN